MGGERFSKVDNMEKYNKTELQELAKGASSVEIYRFRPGSRKIKDGRISETRYNNVDELPYDLQGEIHCQALLMDADEYDRTIGTNFCVSTHDYLTDVERQKYYVLVIVLY